MLKPTLTAERHPQAGRCDDVKTCQVGYLPGETKFAMLTSPPTGPVLIRRAEDGAEICRVAAAAAVADADSGDRICAVDFSALREPGNYFLEAPGVGSGDVFAVGADIFAEPLRLAMRMFSGQRCGTDVDLGPQFPEYRHGGCHSAAAVFDPSSGASGVRACAGGWHDAGDYGRYVVNSAITCGTLLWAYELNPARLGSLNLDIPESGGVMADMLAEIAWNIRWMMSMQDGDGGVWHKLTSAEFPGYVMPEEDAAAQLIIGTGRAPFKTTTATAGFAAVCAIAARVCRECDRGFAQRCLTAAQRAWDWLARTPDHLFAANPQGISTGIYEDLVALDERLWAASELFRTTGLDRYHRYFLDHFTAWNPTLRDDKPQTWKDVHNFAMYGYALSDQASRDERAVQTIRFHAANAADGILARIRRSGYRIALKSDQYYWGSNSFVANYAMMLLLANRLSPHREYVDGALDGLHYLLGRNTFNTSFVTHVGQRWPRNPHHRPSVADGVDEPWPGMLVGGPNAEGRTPPARQWWDEQDNYKVNEVAINWNAPLVFLLADATEATPIS
jgi:endoglucanase